MLASQQRHDRGFDLIHTPLLRHFPALVRALSGDAGHLLAHVGLIPEDCERAGAITCRQWIAVLEQAANQLDAPTFGLMLAERQGGTGIYGRLGGAMRNSQTFGEALRYAAGHSAAHSLGVRIWIGATASGSHVFVGHDILSDCAANRAQALEQLMLLGHLGARYLTGDRVGVRRVHFRHRARAPLSSYAQKFGCEVRFCQNEDGVAFDRAALDAPILDADSAAFHRAAEEIHRGIAGRRPPLQAAVRGLVMQWLATDACGNDEIGDALGIHPRTLLRRLHKEGTSFQKLKDEVRAELMIYYLRETDLELSRISVKLGFAEQSAMSRFARSHFGASPSALRLRMAEAKLSASDKPRAAPSRQTGAQHGAPAKAR
ncbi:MAG: AraC family transcriptional regulator ligand-binding domain-containing protein [Sphingomonadales bacterium]|nr:AraC family transcriptional regulator ligand-binding domain-containing protein [Sphingomonadales bacterium]